MTVEDPLDKASRRTQARGCQDDIRFGTDPRFRCAAVGNTMGIAAPSIPRADIRSRVASGILRSRFAEPARLAIPTAKRRIAIRPTELVRVTRCGAKSFETLL